MSNFVSDFIESRSKFCAEMLCQMQMESAYNFALRFLILFKIKRVELYLEVSDSDITDTIQNQKFMRNEHHIQRENSNKTKG